MQKQRRLNIFAFPPETNALFGMLILASIMLALFFGNALPLLFNAGYSLTSLDTTALGLDAALEFLPGVCISNLALVAVLGVAYFLYRRHPANVRKQRKVKPLGERDAPLKEQINLLALQVEIPSPTVEISDGLKGTDAQAYGAGGAYFLALDGGYRILRKTKPNLFKALIKHELAHIANHDIARSYFSDALWDSIRWTLVPLFVIGIAGLLFVNFISSVIGGGLIEYLQAAIPTAVSLVFQFALTFALAGAIWARLLRMREYYADWKAVIWGGEAGLREILNEEVEKEKPAAGFRLWAYHPSAKERIDTLETPERLFVYSPALFFLAGALISFIFSGIMTEFASVGIFINGFIELRNASTGLLRFFVRMVTILGIIFATIAIFAPISWLINGVVIPQIQKQAALDLFKGQRGFPYYLKLGLLALLFMGGVEFGFLITPFDIFFPNDLPGIVLEAFIVFPFLSGIMFFYLACIRFFSIRLLASQAGETLSVWRLRFLNTVSLVWLLFIIAPAFLLSRADVYGSIIEAFGLSPVLIGLACLTGTMVLLFGVIWGGSTFFFRSGGQKCPHCGKITNKLVPAVDLCEHCQGTLGEWLFVTSLDIKTT